MILGHRKLQRIRAGYIGAAMGAAGLAWLFLSGQMLDVLLGMTGGPKDSLPPDLLAAFKLVAYPTAAVVLALAGLFLFFAWRPYWPGKLVCLLCATSWSLFCVMAVLIGAPASHPAVVTIGAAAVLVLLAGVVHQVNDPRFSGSYARA